MRHWFGEGVGRATSRFRLGAVSAIVVAVGLTGAVSAASLGHSGAPSSVLQLSAGTAWFADTQSGYVSLLDSATQSRVSYRSVAPAGDDIAVVQAGIQSGSGAYVVDHTSGQVTRIDGATLEPAGTAAFSQGADTDLAVVSNAASTWVVERNGTLAAEVSPLTLQPLGSPQPVSQVSTEPIVTANGDMWTAGEGGYVYSFAAGSQQSETRPAAGAVTGLVEAAGSPVVADAAGGRYLVLDSHTGKVARTIPADFPQPSSIVVSGSGVSPYVMAVGTADGDLEVTDVNTGWNRSATPRGASAAPSSAATVCSCPTTRPARWRCTRSTTTISPPSGT